MYHAARCAMLPTMRATPFVLTIALALSATGACAPPARDARGLAIDTPAPAGALETVQQPARVCADGPTVDGIDVSFYQGVIDWNRVAQSSVKFAIVRIGDGLGEDDQFENNWNGARNAGLIRGAYQFFRAARDPDAMADIVIRKVGRLGPGDLPVVLDLEGASIQDQAPATVIANARRWLAAVEAGTGKRPIIYTGFYVWRDQIGDPDFSEYPLWIAAYVNRCPDISDHWNRWTFWQTSDSGRIPASTATSTRICSTAISPRCSASPMAGAPPTARASRRSRSPMPAKSSR
jgi:GH25 family lysozyme M1 (1,4-beta-N-acetylmuramidase)